MGTEGAGRITTAAVSAERYLIFQENEYCLFQKKKKNPFGVTQKHKSSLRYISQIIFLYTYTCVFFFCCCV